MARTERYPDRSQDKLRSALHGDGIALGELALVPVGVDGLGGACGVEFGDLFFGEVPADGTEVLAELFFVACAHDDIGYGGALEEPVERDLRNGLAGFFGDLLDRVHDFVEIFVFDLRAEFSGFVQARNFGDGAVAADFSGDAAPAERTPD
jgi:hypothetical protein